MPASRRLPSCRAVPLLTAALLSAACSTSPPSSGSPTPVAPVASILDTLAGRWDFTVDLGARQTPGELWLFRRGGELTGTLAPTGTNTLPVRSLIVRGDSAHMIVDTPEGPVTFDGAVAASRTGMRGVVTYHHGQRFPMTATRRAAPPPG